MQSTAKAVLGRIFARVSQASQPWIATFLLSSLAFAQGSHDAHAQELVRQAVANEQASPFLAKECTYQYHRLVYGKHETLEMIKTSDLIVGKVVRIDNRPISKAEEHKEDDELRRLLHDASAQQQQRKRQQRFEHYIRELIQSLPQAFRYTETDTEVGAQGARLIHLNFQPAPDFHPASADLEVMRGLSGVMVIDDQRKRIVKLDAHLFRDVDFGWGILVHLNKGGSLLLEREPANPPGADVQNLTLNIDGRILLFKKLEIQWNFDHFRWFDRAIDLASAVNLLTAPDVVGSISGSQSR
ncbi:MAG TPA: hypothetical protein VEK33_15210 [Terriglobales bacterium]|nr:hypothetical protein [Terriglobales bacterium]